MIDSSKTFTPAQKLGLKISRFRRDSDIKAMTMADLIGLSKNSFSGRELGRTNWTALELITLCRKYPALITDVLAEDFTL